MPDPILYKAGFATPEDPYDFVMSTGSPDAHGDIVVQDWDLRQFKRNPIALWMHSSRDVIGTWENVGVAGGKLQGTLKPARRGTSAVVDEVLNLLEQGILRAVSVGFRAEKAEPLDKDDPWSGYRLTGNKLLECSVVSLPANDEALRKYIKSIDPVTRAALLSKSGGYPCEGVCAQLTRSPSQASDPTAALIPQSTRSTTMSLADKIKAKQEEILRHKDAIAGIAGNVDDTGSLSQDQMDLIDELTAKIEDAQGHLKSLEKLERSVAESVGTPAAGAPVPRIEVRSRMPAKEKAGAALACIVKGLLTNQSPLDIARNELKDLPEMDLLVRAATAPAVTGTDAWGGNLVQETWGPLVEELYAMTVYGKVPGLRLTFNGVRNLPVQGGKGNLAGDFIAENGVIPVKAGSIGTVSLQPHTLGVISAYSKELMRRSVPAIQSLVQNQIMQDTARTIDQKFLDAVARTAGTRPAGLRDATETVAANINAVVNVATGAGNATAKEINTTTRAMLGRVWAIDAGGSGVWLMNPAQRLSLEDKQDGTTGHFVFRDEVQRGRFRGFPIVESTNVPASYVYFVAADSMAFGTELMPYFEQSDQATLHFEGATPASISVSDGEQTPAAEVAFPVYNLWQQNLVAIKGIWTLDWRITRAGGVQVLTGADGW